MSTLLSDQWNWWFIVSQRNKKNLRRLACVKLTSSETDWDFKSANIFGMKEFLVWQKFLEECRPRFPFRLYKFTSPIFFKRLKTAYVQWNAQPNIDAFGKNILNLPPNGSIAHNPIQIFLIFDSVPAILRTTWNTFL